MTHKQRVLRLLSDNQPHSHLEGYRLGVMLHSRVADLRRDGYEIKCWAEGGMYLYQLFGTVREGEAAADGASPLGPPRTSAGGPSPVLSADSAGSTSGSGALNDPSAHPIQL